MLGAISATLGKIDRSIEETGFTYSVLGAVVRIFIMEKENLRGEDVLELGTLTAELYRTLIRRTKRFGQIFGAFWGESDAWQKTSRAVLPVVDDRRSPPGERRPAESY